MNKFLRAFLLLIIIIFCQNLIAQNLKIDKIEPPNWWGGMKWNKLQLMIYGENLNGIEASFEDDIPIIHSIQNVPNSNYAFINIELPESLISGEFTLHIKKGKEQVSVIYPVLERANNPSHHNGFDQSDVIYLITPDRFANGDPTNDHVEGMFEDTNRADHQKRHGGDLKGLIEQLDYLEDLGVTAIWLNPVLENNLRGSYHGYAATDLYKIDARFGSNEDYKMFVEAAHQRGLKVIFDHINNHIGVKHPWLENMPTEDWINGGANGKLRDKHYKHSMTDPHADEHSEELLQTFWFVDKMPDLNQRNSFLANYLIQNTLWWMEYSGLDGIREDTYPYPFQDFMADWVAAILEEYPKSNVVGEIWALEPAYLSMFQKESFIKRNFRSNLPCIMDFPLSHALREYMIGEGKLNDVYTVFAQDFLYTDLSNIMTFFDNHDMARATFISKTNTKKIKQSLAILLTSRGIPQLLYGSEINMVGGERHVELRADFPGGFQGDTRSAFTEEGRTDAENDIFNYHRKLLHLRKKHTALSTGKMIHYPLKWRDDVYKYLKITEEETILVIINGHDEKRKVDLSELEHHLMQFSTYQNLLNEEKGQLHEQKGIEIESLGILILKLNN